MTDLHVILSQFPLLKSKKFVISLLINEHRPLILWENNMLTIPPQTQKGIEGFNKELADLHPVLPPSQSIKCGKFIIPHSINKQKPLVLLVSDIPNIPP